MIILKNFILTILITAIFSQQSFAADISLSSANSGSTVTLQDGDVATMSSGSFVNGDINATGNGSNLLVSGANATINITGGSIVNQTMADGVALSSAQRIKAYDIGLIQVSNNYNSGNININISGNGSIKSDNGIIRDKYKYNVGVSRNSINLVLRDFATIYGNVSNSHISVKNQNIELHNNSAVNGEVGCGYGAEYCSVKLYNSSAVSSISTGGGQSYIELNDNSKVTGGVVLDSFQQSDLVLNGNSSISHDYLAVTAVDSPLRITLNDSSSIKATDAGGEAFYFSNIVRRSHQEININTSGKISFAENSGIPNIGNTDQIIVGKISTRDNNSGLGATLNINGDFTSNGFIGVDQINNKAIFAVQNNIKANKFNNNSTLIALKNFSLEGDYVAAANSIFSPIFSGVNSGTKMTVNGNVDLSNSRIRPVVSNNVLNDIANDIAAGGKGKASFDIISATGTLTTNNLSFPDNNGLIVWSVAPQNSSPSAGGLSLTSAASTNPNVLTISAIFNPNSPSVPINPVTATLVSTGKSIDIALDKVGGGVSSGDVEDSIRVWGQGFGAKVDQGSRKGKLGYDSNSAGVVFGADAALDNYTRAGVSLSYAQSNVKSESVYGSRININSYQAALYGKHNITNKFYAKGALSAAINQNNSKRSSSSAVNEGDHTSYQYGIKTQLGYKMNTSVKNLYITPYIGKNYVYVKSQGYKESGAGGLVVGKSKNKIFETTIGASSNYVIQKKSFTMSPVVGASWSRDHINKAITNNVSFVGAQGAAFKIDGFKPDNDRFDVNVGFNITSNKEFAVNFDYTRGFSDKKKSDSVVLEFSKKF